MQHIECISCTVQIPNLIRNSRNARRCRQEIARLSDSNRDGIAELPITRAYFHRFMDMIQSEGEGSATQETSSEQFPAHVPQHFNNDANLQQVNLTEGMSQEVPTTATSMYTFANTASHVPELPSNESLTLPQPLFPHPVPVQTPAVGLPQDLYGNGFQNISFTNLGFGVPTIPTNSTPVDPHNMATPHSASATLVFHLQAIARSMGFVLVPMPGGGN